MVAAVDANILLNTILEGMGQPFYAVDGEWRITLYNEDAARHFGRPATEMLGRRLWDVFAHDVHAERGRILFDAMARRAIVKGETLSMIGDRWVSYCMFPLGDGLGVIFRDITDHRNAEEQRDRAEEALRKRTAELQTVLETVPTAVWFTYDRDLRNVIGNRRALDMLRLPREADLAAVLQDPANFRVYRNDEEVPPGARPLHRAARGEEVKDELLEVRFDNGDRRTLLMRAVPLRDSAGAVQGAVCAAADVTERHRYESHLKLLLSELTHRVKNTLTVVQSIAAITLKDIEPTVRSEFDQRLLTLGSVHNLLTDQNWNGAQLHDVARASLSTHLGGGRERLNFDGEDLRLHPRSAIALSMALHELATNALKYGALSAEGGRVSVRWSATDERFRLRWEESGGPIVVAPKRKGFGSRMIEQALAMELQGDVRIDYLQGGVVCTIDAPLDAIRDGKAEV
jgi:two-component sensor histidine kinase